MSPHTTATGDNGTPSSSAAIMAIVVFAPGPMSVTPTNSVYRPSAFTLRIALLGPTPDRNIMNAMPAPRLIGPGSEPGSGRQRLSQSKSSRPCAMHSSSK